MVVAEHSVWGKIAARLPRLKKESREENGLNIDISDMASQLESLSLSGEDEPSPEDEEKKKVAAKPKPDDREALVKLLQIDIDQEKKLKKVRETCNEHEQIIIGGVVIPSEINTTFADVHVPLATIETLRTLTTLSLVRPDAFTYGVLADNKILGVLLYGPPGTGKTHLAKALAKESGATVLEISGADVLQQYVGEGEKVVRAIFSLARKLDPCIIFFDEADAVFRARSDDEKGYHRELINQFLREWDGITGGKSKGGFMMVATNRPYDLDEAVLRRLPRRILVDMPTVEDREAILKIYLNGEKLGDDVDISKLAVSTPNYTGSDIKNLCVAAAFACVYEEIKTVNNGLASFPGTRLLRLALAKAKFPARRTLYARHFDKAIEEVSGTIDTNSINRIRDFHRRRRVPQPERHVELPPAPTRTKQSKTRAAPA